MFQSFFVNNLASKFIKNLLATTNIPNAKFWKPGNPIIKYLYYYDENGNMYEAIDDKPTDTDNITVFDKKYFRFVSTYLPEEPIKNITSTYISNSNNYDSLTHYNLGKYLRFVRDYKNLNLMMYYNCWCGEYSTSISIKNNRIEDTPNAPGLYKTYLVPIVYEQDYTIFYNSSFPIKVAPVYYDGISVIDLYSSSNTDRPIHTINYISFNQPYLYQKYRPTDNNLKLKEDYLYLLIQVPQDNKSGLVVLEGNYTNLKLINRHTDNNLYNKLCAVNYGYLDEAGQKFKFSDFDADTQNSYFIAYPELLRISDNSFAFSDTLLQYLLLNVVDHTEQISNNISKVQQDITNSNISKWNSLISYEQPKSESVPVKVYSKPYFPGIWDVNMRKYLYDLVKYNTKGGTCFDITGYVDKNVEDMITRGTNG